MHLLEEALVGKDCQIIISSSWRFHHPFKYLQSLFTESIRGQVAGVTGGAFVGRWPRHSEILIDVSNRGAQGRWRALDDSWHPPKPVDTFYKAVSMVSHPLTI